MADLAEWAATTPNGCSATRAGLRRAETKAAKLATTCGQDAAPGRRGGRLRRAVDDYGEASVKDDLRDRGVYMVCNTAGILAHNLVEIGALVA